MDFAKAFSFVFEDPDWAKKVVIGGLIALIPVVGQLLVFGYMIGVARNVIRRNPQPLPEWSDFGQLLVDGLYMFIISVIYTLPIFIVMCLVLFPSLAIGGDLGNGDELSAIGILGVVCFSCFSALYGLAIGWFFIPAASVRYADTNDLMSALRIGEVLALTRANPLVFLMALVIYIVANFVAGFGIILCFIGVLFTQFYAQCVTGHAYGQAYLIAQENTV